MECFIVLPEDVEEGTLLLRDEEAHHAIRSLRLRAGDILLATNLIGTCYRCQLLDHDRDATSIKCEIGEVLPEYCEPRRDILLIQGAISQPARWEFLIEKATELGVRIIQPVITERTERSHFKLDRSERILRAAVKQTKRARKPEIRLTQSGELNSLTDALTQAASESRTVYLAHESAAQKAEMLGMPPGLPNQPIAIVIGPEGGFTDEEVERASSKFGAQIISLGPRRLRAETAAIAALAIMMER